MKKVFIIARVFPPFSVVGHSIRVVKFIKYLPGMGWLPSVLTINDCNEYEFDRKVGSETLLSEIPQEVSIYRTTAGEFPLWFIEMEKKIGRRNWLTKVIVRILSGTRRWAFRNLFLPDRYLTWLPFALQRGRKIIKSEGVDVIFATCPPFSTTLIGAFLKLVTGKPLILDFRDDWIETPWYCSRIAIRRWIERKMEEWAIRTADKVILVTEWSKRAFMKRYPTQSSNKFALISNGCDLVEFTVLNSMTKATRNCKFTILHAGSINVSKYWGRNPKGLFQSIQKILLQQSELSEKLSLVFAGDLPEEYRNLAKEMGLSGIIKVLGHISHREVLSLIKSADL
ncbi:glycosyltransferase, partial [Calditrichota bacterium]